MGKKAYFRFYEELNDFLPEVKRKKKFPHEFEGRVSIKDMIESLGVPHTEIDLILVNGKSVDFNHIVEPEDEVSVYPVFESFDISNVQHLRSKPLREPKFILDVHLGKLASLMRMLGIDSLYRNDYNDQEIINIAVQEKRTILTKDLGILKNSKVTRGYWIRNTEPEKQIEEVIRRFDLMSEIREFSRCLECNAILEVVEKEKIIHRLPPKVKERHNDFYICRRCDKIYWKGTHYEDMLKLIHNIRNRTGG